MENRSRRTPIEWAAGSGFVFLLWFSGGALCPHTRFAGQKNNLYNGKG
jgi:hypothetical protein